MDGYFRAATTLILIGILAGGCVSSGKFKKMEADKNGEIDVLQRANADLENQKSALNHQRMALKGENQNLSQRVESLEQKNAGLEKQIGSLSQEKASLEAAGRQQRQEYETLLKGLSSEVEKGQLQVRQYQNMLAVDLAEKIFFDSGRAELKPGGKAVLKKVGEALKGYENKIIRVVGHSDNVPVSKSLQAKFPSNWELSVARATTVVRFLQEVGVPPERMIPSGRGEYDPVDTNDTPEGRQKNRRIEILLIDRSLARELSPPGD